MTRIVSRRGLGALAGLGSAAILLGALGFQYIADLVPCPLCIWQRWPHLAAVALAVVLVLVWPGRIVALLGAAAAAATSAIGVYHAGVEQGWWQGPSTCTAADPGALSSSDLLDTILATPLVRCDEIVWQFLGVTMAGWNAIASAGLALIWLGAAAVHRRH